MSEVSDLDKGGSSQILNIFKIQSKAFPVRSDVWDMRKREDVTPGFLAEELEKMMLPSAVRWGQLSDQAVWDKD